MASNHAAHLALPSGQEERTSDVRTRVHGEYGTVAATRSACDATQDYARSAETTEFCKQYGLQVSTRFNPRDLSDCAAGILARSTDINFFYEC